MNVNIPEVKLVRAVWTFREKFDNLSAGECTSLSERKRLRNVRNLETHVQGVQNFWFCTLNLLFCGILVAVVVALLNLPNDNR